MKELLIISDGKSLSEINDFFLDRSLREWLRIIFWEIKPIFSKDKVLEPLDNELPGKHQKFERIADFEEALILVKNDIDICFYFGWSRPESNKVYALLNSLGITWVRFNMTPALISMRKAYENGLKRMLRNIIYEVKHNAKVRPNYITTVGNTAQTVLTELGRVKSIPINGLDYEKFLLPKNDGGEKVPYIVYIDQNLVKHRDFKNWSHLSMGSYDYYNQLALFFKAMQSHYEMPIKIALHYTNVDKQFNEIFQDFEKIKSETNDLVADAKMVLGHFSSAIAYGVVYQKPIQLLSFGRKYAYGQAYTTRMAKVLKCPLVEIDAFQFDGNLPKINQEAYSTYIKNYLCSDQLEVLNREKIKSFLIKKLLKQ